MPPKTDGPPRPKKVMTPEMLEKLAAARAKANVARAAMKSDNDELKLQLLQRKMDAIKNTTMKVKAPTKNEMKVKPDTPEPMTEPMTEEMPDTKPQSDDIPTKPEPHIQCSDDTMNVSNDTVSPPASPVKAIKKKKKPVVIVENSDSDSDDNSEVIYIRRKSKSKLKEQPPQVSAPPPQAPKPQMKPIINPFFSYYHGSHRNFQ